MKLSKRVYNKKGTKKGKNGKKSNRVKQSKKRQNRKINKKTQKGGLLDNHNLNNIEALLCDTQTLVEKSKLISRKDNNNTGFFYVSQNTALPSTMDNNTSSILKEGLVVELKNGILGYSNNNHNTSMNEDERIEIPESVSLLNNENKLPGTLHPVYPPMFSVRCGGQEEVYSQLTLDNLANLISKNIKESIRKYRGEIPKTLLEEEQKTKKALMASTTELEKAELKKQLTEIEEKIKYYIFEMVLRELNKITGLVKIRQIELETIKFFKNNREQFMELVDFIEQLSNDNELPSKNVDDTTDDTTDDTPLHNSIKAVLFLETYNGPGKSYSNLQENGLNNGKVKKLAQMFQRGGKQKGGLSPKYMKRILFPILVGGLTALSVFTGGAMVIPSLLIGACIYHGINIEVRSEQISKWICGNLVNLNNSMKRELFKKLKKFVFEGYSSKFKRCLNVIRELIKRVIKKKYNSNFDKLSDEALDEALDYLEDKITNVEVPNKLNELKELKELGPSPSYDLSSYDLYIIERNCILFNKIYNGFEKTVPDPKKTILKYIYKALIFSKHTDDMHTIKRLLSYYLDPGSEEPSEYGFKFILFGIGETEKYMKKLNEEGEC